MFRRRGGDMRRGNRFALIGDGRRFLQRMIAVMDAAEEYILAEFYLVESGAVTDAFIAAFARAAARGVRVRIVFDAFGARGLAALDRARLRDCGAELVFYNSLRWRDLARILLRDHRKLLIVDGKTGFTGGIGLSDQFSPDARPDTYWWDCIIEINGPVLLDWHLLFADTWRRCRERPLDVAPRASEPLVPGEDGRVVASAGFGSREIARSLIKRIKQAERRVWISTAYFWPSLRLRRALRRAARRGVDVRLLLPGPLTDAPLVRSSSRLFYSRLLAAGIVIHEYQSRFLHAKMTLCDDVSSIGSSNLDRWGALWNLEANQEVDSPVFARQVEAAFAQIAGQSIVLRNPGDLDHPWTAYLWWHVAKWILAWSTRAVARLRR